MTGIERIPAAMISKYVTDTTPSQVLIEFNATIAYFLQSYFILCFFFFVTLRRDGYIYIY